MDLETSLKKLFSLHTFGIRLGLDNTLAFLNKLGNPQNDLRCIHVAGSNGKGSTSSFIASILMEFGFRVGLYTSPHFVKFNERIVKNGIRIDDEYIASFISDNEKFIDEKQLTFFEVTTAMAFQYFKSIGTDYCVIETGLGGRLDSTNVLSPLAVVITSISLEHTNILGDTIELITAEKAAIIKNNIKVFTGILKKEASGVIEQRCKETNSKFHDLKNFITSNDDQLELTLGDLVIQINSPLRGNYQKFNAALAALTISKTMALNDEEKYYSGITNVLKNTGLQGRYEYYHKNPTIIFDSAHNPEGIENFLTEFARETANYKEKVLIFGAMRDKNIRDMLQQLSSYFDEILLSEINYDRAAKHEEIKSICDELNINCDIIHTPAVFIKNFKTKRKEDCLVVLGSMYLLGEIKQQLLQ